MYNSKPLVTVIIITYNQEKYIKETIESVLKQKTDFFVELLIVNDCSPDNSDNIIKDAIKFSPSNFKVIYRKHQKNLGMMPNFLWSLSQAQGELIAMCEGDDFWSDESKLQLQKEAMQDRRFSLVFHAASTMNNNGKLNTFNYNFYKISQKIEKKNFLQYGGGGFATASILFRKSILSDLPKYFLNCKVGDYPLAFLAAVKGDIYFINRNMATYRIEAENSWSTKLDHDKIMETINGEFVFIKNFHRETKKEYLVFTSLLMQRLYAQKTIYLYLSGNKKKSFIFFAQKLNKMGMKNILRVVKIYIKKLW